MGGDYFKYFRQRGAIIRGRRLMKGQLLFKETFSQYVRKYNSWDGVRLALTVLLDVITPFRFNIL